MYEYTNINKQEWRFFYEVTEFSKEALRNNQLFADHFNEIVLRQSVLLGTVGLLWRASLRFQNSFQQF